MKRGFCLLLTAVMILFITGCGDSQTNSAVGSLQVTGRMPLSYATQFSVDFCDGGYAYIHIGADDFLLVPEDCAIPPENTLTVIRQPASHIYAASSAVMDLFDAIDGLEAVDLTSTDEISWTLPRIQDAIRSGNLTYIGKYSAPDYEALVETDCGLVIENTMIYHAPAVKEQIESLGIPVIVERSSYESHPLGRMEWIKLYGLLLGRLSEAEQYFDDKTADFRNMNLPDIPDDQRKTVAFFSITANGAVNIRKPGDYIPQMIQMAGGRYIFTAEELNIDENALSTMNIQMESFYQTAKEADVLIYNSTIEGQLDKISELLQKSELFQDFRAVQNGNVWCTEQNTFQQTTGAADMISDFNRILSGEADSTDQLVFLHRLK